MEFYELAGNFLAGIYNIQFTVFQGVGDYTDGITIKLGNTKATAKALFNAKTFSAMCSLTPTSLESTITTIALQVLTLMVLIDFIDKALKFNKETSWEMILFTMVKFAVYLFLIDHIRVFLQDIMAIAFEILSKGSGFGKKAGMISDCIKQILKSTHENPFWPDLIPRAKEEYFLSELIITIVFIALAIPIVQSQMALWTPVFLKLISFAALIIVSPIVVALLYGGHGPESRAFIMKAISICLELILMYIILVMYSKGFGSMAESIEDYTFNDSVSFIIGLFFYNSLFGAAMSEVQNLAGQILR